MKFGYGFGESTPLNGGFNIRSTNPLGLWTGHSLTDVIGQSVKRVAAPVISGTTYYCNTANTYHGNGRSPAPAISAGAEGAFNNYSLAISALLAGDGLLFLPGAHVSSASKTLSVACILSTYGCENVGDASIIFGNTRLQVGAHTGEIIIHGLGLKDSTDTNGVLSVQSSHAAITRIYDCLLTNNNIALNLRNAFVDFQRNIIAGVTNAAKCIFYEATTAAIADYESIISNNIIIPSADNLGGNAWFKNAHLSIGQTVDFYNNTILGAITGTPVLIQADGGAIKPTIRGANNLLFGGSFADSDNVSELVNSSAGAAANATFTNNLLMSPCKTGLSLGALSTGITASDNLATIPKIKRYPRKGALMISIDDTSAFETANPLNTGALIPILAEYGVSMTWFVTAGSVGAGATAAIQDWIEAGNEIGIHNFAHSSMFKITCLQGVTKAATTLTISIDDSDADSANWTGTVAIDGGASVTIDGNPLDATNISRLSQLKTWLESQGVTVAAPAESFSYDSLAVILADQTSLSIASPVNLPIDDVRFKHTELVYSKSYLENIIRNIDSPDCAGYTIESYAPPYNDIDLYGMDVLKTAGYSAARGGLETGLPWANTMLCNSKTPLYIYTIGAIGFGTSDTAFGALKDSVSGAVTPELVHGNLSWSAIGGGCFALYIHSTSGTVADFRALLDGAAELVDMGNFQIGSHRQIIGYVRENGTQILGDGSGRQEQWYLTYEDGYGDYQLDTGSPCIGTGTVTALTGTANLYDAAGIQIYSGTTELPDGPYLDGVDIGAFAYVVDGKYFLNLLGPEGAKYWPSAPELIAITGVDNAVYDANGVGKTFATPALALAALATVEDNIKLFVGWKGAVLFDTDKSADLVRIQRAGY